jgi:3-oxoacyl-[acyl-carrier protein] reductase
MRNLQGKRALVTGAASGIGRAIALALADAGVRLHLLDIDEANLATVADLCRNRGVEAAAQRCDVSQPAQISAAIEQLLSQSGGVDILINNAGVGAYGRTERFTAEQWDRLLAINLLAPIQFTRELLPTLLQRDEAHIVNICSILGLVAGKRMTAYQTSKFALVGLSKSLRAEYVRRGLGVTALCPGFVTTNMFSSAQTDKVRAKPLKPPRWMLTTSESVAAAALRAIRRNRGVVTITPMARILWWLDRWIPGPLEFFARTPWRKRSRDNTDE